MYSRTSVFGAAACPWFGICSSSMYCLFIKEMTNPARARDTIELLTRISREEGLTLCMSLHNFELAREHLPRLIGLRDGKVVFDCASEEIGDEQFDALYTLEKNEMWRDGS